MKPEVKKYLNVCQYLQDFYQYRKTQDSKFSYDSWAQELGASDKSYVRLLVIGKRPINKKMAESFLENLGLLSEEKKYFSILVEYSQSKTREQREVFGKKLISLLGSELNQLEVKSHYEFLSNPLLPRLQIFLSFNDIDPSVHNLAWLLGTTKNEIEVALEKLLNLGLIEKVGDSYKPLKKSFKVQDNFCDLGLEAFYTKNLDSAKAAIHLPKEERRFKSLFLPLDKKEFDEFWSNLQGFVNEQLAKFNPDEYAERILYQTHFNIIPVSFGKKVESAIDDDFK